MASPKAPLAGDRRFDSTDSDAARATEKKRASVTHRPAWARFPRGGGWGAGGGGGGEGGGGSRGGVRRTAKAIAVDSRRIPRFSRRGRRVHPIQSRGRLPIPFPLPPITKAWPATRLRADLPASMSVVSPVGEPRHRLSPMPPSKPNHTPGGEQSKIVDGSLRESPFGTADV